MDSDVGVTFSGSFSRPEGSSVRVSLELSLKRRRGSSFQLVST